MYSSTPILGPLPAWECCTQTDVQEAGRLDAAKVLVVCGRASVGALQVFKSHCAPEPQADAAPAQLTIAQLKASLRVHGLPLAGRKADLAARLATALAQVHLTWDASNGKSALTSIRLWSPPVLLTGIGMSMPLIWQAAGLAARLAALAQVGLMWFLPSWRLQPRL